VHRSRLPAPPVPGGFGLPLGFLAAVIVTCLAVAAGATTHPQRALTAFVVTIAVIAGISTPWAALGTAAVSWALHTGFVLGRHGNLTVTPPASQAALVLGAVALLTSAVAVAVRAADHQATGSGHG